MTDDDRCEIVTGLTSHGTCPKCGAELICINELEQTLEEKIKKRTDDLK